MAHLASTSTQMSDADAAAAAVAQLAGAGLGAAPARRPMQTASLLDLPDDVLEVVLLRPEMGIAALGRLASRCTRLRNIIMGAPTKAGVATQGPLRALAKARLMGYDLKAGLADRGFGDPWEDAEREGALDQSRRRHARERFRARDARVVAGVEADGWEAGPMHDAVGRLSVYERALALMRQREAEDGPHPLMVEMLRCLHAALGKLDAISVSLARGGRGALATGYDPRLIRAECTAQGRQRTIVNNWRGAMQRAAKIYPPHELEAVLKIVAKREEAWERTLEAEATFTELFEQARGYGTLQWEGWIHSLRGGHALIDDVYDGKRLEDLRPRKPAGAGPAHP